MEVLIQKLLEGPETDPKAPATPTGWLTISQLEKIEQDKERNNVKEFEKSVSRYLPQAAKKAQKLVSMLDNKLDIRVPVSYLTIENSTTFHVVMLVNQSDYLSPEMVKARMMASWSNQQNEEFDIHYTFTVDVQFLGTNTNSTFAPNYKLKHIPDFAKNLQVELLYMHETA